MTVEKQVAHRLMGITETCKYCLHWGSHGLVPKRFGVCSLPKHKWVTEDPEALPALTHENSGCSQFRIKTGQDPDREDNQNPSGSRTDSNRIKSQT